MTLLEEYFIRLVETELRAPVPVDQLDQMLTVSLSTARIMVDRVKALQPSPDVKELAVDRMDSSRSATMPPINILAVNSTADRHPSKAALNLSEIDIIARILRTDTSVSAHHPNAIAMQEAGLIENQALVTGEKRWRVTEAGIAALALGSGLRSILSDSPKAGEDVLVFGFIDGVWCSAISSLDDRPYRLGYLHKKGIGFGWATFWAPLPTTPEWAKDKEIAT